MFFVEGWTMGVRDIILTPFYLVIIYLIAYRIRESYYKTSELKKYFIPALSMKIIGAISLCLIYQFYYGPESSDSFGYYKGSKDIWNAFIQDPLIGLKIIFASAGEFDPDTYPYVHDMWGLYRNPRTFFVVRIGATIGLFTFGTFLPISITISFLSFLVSWKLYETFVAIYPDLYNKLIIPVFFLPSVFFWGSGLLKDTVTFACLAGLVFVSYQIFLKKQYNLIYWIVLFICAYIIAQIKLYILLCFLLPLIIWIFLVLG